MPMILRIKLLKLKEGMNLEIVLKVVNSRSNGLIFIMQTPCPFQAVRKAQIRS
jgi:hypothetical protein